MVVTLSDANSELSDSDNEKKGKFMAFIALVDLEKVTVETDLVCSSKDELDEEATLQDAYSKLYKTAARFEKACNLALKKFNEVELEKEGLIV